MANPFFGVPSGSLLGPHPLSQVGIMGPGPQAGSINLDPSTNNQPLQFKGSKIGRRSTDEKDNAKESTCNISSSTSSSGPVSGPTNMMPGPSGLLPAPPTMMPSTAAMMSTMSTPSGIMPGSGPAGMMPGPNTMMMPWAAMMGPMMGDPSMMMWGPWGGMGLMNMVEGETLPQAQREMIKLKNVVLHPPPPNSGVPNTRERPPGCKTIFVGGLPENATEEMLQEMFANCGSICSLRLSKKGFAHIRFTSMEAVDKALFFSGYRMKIDDKEDKANAGRLHVDFAQARDDLHEWECQQRQMQRETRHRELMEERKNRPPSPPAVVHFSDHEALVLTESLKASDTFEHGAQTLVTWLDRGDCNRRTSNVFYTLIQSANGHVKRLMTEKKECSEELEQMKLKFQIRLEAIVHQLDQIDRIFATASKQKSWDHFTKAQRKNLDAWRKQLQILKAQQEAEFLQNRGGEAEMEMSDNESGEHPSTSSKRKRVKVESAQSTEQTTESMLSLASEWIGQRELRDENDVLKCQLEALKNEVDIVKLEAKESVDNKDKQLKCLQMALQGMQQQLLNATQQAKKSEDKLKELQLKVQVATSSENNVVTESIKASSSAEEIAVKKSSSADEVAAKNSSSAEEIAVKQSSSAEEVDDLYIEISTKDLQCPVAHEAAVSSEPAHPSPNVKEARLIALICTFLLVHPLGANIDYIWSYLNRLNVKMRSSELEELLEKYPSVFAGEDSGHSAERRWKFVAYDRSA